MVELENCEDLDMKFPKIFEDKYKGGVFLKLRNTIYG